MNPGGRGCSEPISCHLTPTWEIEQDSVSKQKKTLEILSFATWMNLEDIMLSEISHARRDKYYAISFVCVVLKVELADVDSRKAVSRNGGWSRWGKRRRDFG